MKKTILIVLLTVIYATVFSQAANDNCSNAIEICMAKSRKGDTKGATNEICATCADGVSTVGSTCFTMDRTVWYKFTTISAGDISVNLWGIACNGTFTGLSGIVYFTSTPCNSATYTAISNCVSNSNGFNLTATGLLASTTYYIQISSEAGSECDFDIAISGTSVTAAPSTISITNDITVPKICPEDMVTFTPVITNCDNPIVHWYAGGYIGSSKGSATFSSNYFVDGAQVKAEVECDCNPNSTSNFLTIPVHPYITVSAGSYVNIPFGGTTQLQGTGGITYSWSPPDGLSDPNISNPIARPLETTNYTLTATSAEGCRFFSSVIVNVIDSIFVPNTFTPNGDGINDTWQINLIDNFPKANIKVFDRWGQRVFNTIGYPASKRWDGTYNGRKLPASTYYYTISLSVDTEKERIKTGSVTIIR